jgi:hypothetical protein
VFHGYLATPRGDRDDHDAALDGPMKLSDNVREMVTHKLKLNQDCKPGNVRFCNVGYALQVPFPVGRQVGSNPANLHPRERKGRAVRVDSFTSPMHYLGKKPHPAQTRWGRRVISG